MKRKILTLATLAITVASCSEFSLKEPGKLEISIHSTKAPSALTSARTSEEAPPSTDDFILLIKGSDEKIIYEGRFGDSPESLSLSPGSYSVSAFSCYFESPEYSKPQYGDSQIVVVGSGESARADLYCKQLNSGIRLKIDDSFKECFPQASLYLSADDGELAYSYDENRIAFFKPGAVAIAMSEDGSSQTLFSRSLEAQQILEIQLKASANNSTSGISLQIDSSRTWLSESFTYGEDNASEIWGAYDINSARQNLGKKKVWVKGYIVGTATSNSKIDFEAPFEKSTNIILGLRSNTTDKSYCLSVELKSGAIRDDLNLADNPTLKGQHVYIKGDLVSSYYGLPGLKNLEEYQIGD